MKTVKMTKEYSDFLIESILKFETIVSDVDYLNEANNNVQSDLLEFDYGLIVNSNKVLMEADLNKAANSATSKLYKYIDKKKAKVKGGFKTFLNKIVSFIKKHWKALLGIAALGGGATLFGYVIKRGAVAAQLFNKAYSLKENWETFENLINTDGKSKGDKGSSNSKIKSIYNKMYNFLRKVRDFITQSYKAFKNKVKDDGEKASRLDKIVVSAVKSFNEVVLWVAKKFKGFKIPGLKSKTENITIMRDDIPMPITKDGKKEYPAFKAFRDELNKLR